MHEEDAVDSHQSRLEPLEVAEIVVRSLLFPIPLFVLHVDCINGSIRKFIHLHRCIRPRRCQSR